MDEIAFQAVLLCVGFLFSLSLLIRFKKGKDEEQSRVYYRTEDIKMIFRSLKIENGGNIH